MLLRWPLLPTEDELRDFVVRSVRDGIDDPGQRDRIATEIERHWQSDQKRNKRRVRRREAKAIDEELANMIATGVPVVEARTLLARRHGHNSVAAFQKWMSRNRLTLLQILYPNSAGQKSR